MKTEIVRLSQVKVNQNNPRTIREQRLNLLVERMLVFPKFITVRPVVVDDKMVVLGGNMRVNALNKIAKTSFEQLSMTIGKTKNYQRLTEEEKRGLLAHWQEWLEKPTVEIVRASDLSEEEKKEFIIADNASFGEWDYDALANKWDTDDLNSWGVDIWRPDPPQGTANGVGSTTSTAELSEHEGQVVDTTNLPPELQGQDLSADELPKIVGTDEVAMERVIIVYPKEREDDIAKMIGVEKVEKVVYSINELIPQE